MKRFHVHVAVDDLDASVRFYSALFAAEPTVRKSDYAKWMMEDPRVNFAISARGSVLGLNHLGIQVESADELEEMRGRTAQAGQPYVEERDTECCYVKSDKYWIADPQGIAWESFHTLENVPLFAGYPGMAPERTCCAPTKLEAPVQPQANVCCSPSSTTVASTQACCK